MIPYPSHRPPPPAHYDCERFWIHFVVGALFGAGMGFFYWMLNWHVGLSMWRCTCFPALAIALVGGVFGGLLLGAVPQIFRPVGMVGVHNGNKMLI